jgi:hypothetical protein
MSISLKARFGALVLLVYVAVTGSVCLASRLHPESELLHAGSMALFLCGAPIALVVRRVWLRARAA